MTERKCKNCEFWCRDPRNYAKGECRAHAPRLARRLGYRVEHKDAEWPVSEYDDWCGEFVEKEGPRG